MVARSFDVTAQPNVCYRLQVVGVIVVDIAGGVGFVTLDRRTSMY